MSDDDYTPVGDRLDAIMERINAERRAWPLWRKVWMWLRWNVFQPARAFPRRVVWTAQRAKRGWSDYDAWGADHYIARVNAELMAHLRDIAHGHPVGLGLSDDEPWLDDEAKVKRRAEIAEIDAEIGYDGSIEDGFERWKAMLTFFEDGWRAYLRYSDEYDEKAREQFEAMLPLYGRWFGGLWD